MKKILFVLLTILSIVLCGCSDLEDYNISSTQLKISNVGQNGKMGFGQSSFSFDIECDKEHEWSVEGPDWVSIDPKSGSGNAKITVALKDSTSKESMSDVITVKCNDRAPEIPIENVPFVFNASINDNTTFSRVEGTVTISVNCNEGLEWDSSIDQESQWLRYDTKKTGAGTGSITLSYGNNGGRYSRPATIYVYPKNRKDLKESIIVEQNPTLGAYPQTTNYYFEGEGGASNSKILVLNNNTTDLNFHVSDDWVHYNIIDNNHVEVYCDKNKPDEPKRDAELSIEGPDTTHIVSVHQDILYYITTGDEPVKFSKRDKGKQRYINVTSNVINWNIAETLGTTNWFYHSKESEKLLLIELLDEPTDISEKPTIILRSAKPQEGKAECEIHVEWVP